MQQSVGQPITSYLSQQFCSYIPQNLYDQLNSSAISVTQQTRLLIKLQGGAESKQVADKIRVLEPNDVTIDSVSQEIQQRQNNASMRGMLNIMELGVVFFALSASVGTALVVFTRVR